MTERLSARTLKAPLPYDRSGITPGIVHLGVGAFQRAHIGDYVDGLLAGDPTWGIVGASLRKADMRHALAPQDFLYTQLVRSGEGDKAKVIGSLLDVVDASSRRDALLQAMIDPRIRIVSLTVTEKGYCHNPATGMLDESHPNIQRDLANPGAPVSVPALLLQALELRRQARLKPFTILSCDNLPANGALIKRIVKQFAALRKSGLENFVENDVSFPSCMVDRIVPATTDGDRAVVRSVTGLDDFAPVITEHFSQWVIEDEFGHGRPDFERVGVQLVKDVGPYEQMKLRMLNGGHSTLAYLSCIVGIDFVSEAIADPHLRKFIHDLMTLEVMPTLPAELGDLHTYSETLLQRFANPALKHRTLQIAMDGSQKLPQRLLGTIRERLAQGQPITRSSLALAAWMRFVTGVDERGRLLELNDPLKVKLRSVVALGASDPEEIVHSLLQIKEVFGVELPRNAGFAEILKLHLRSLFADGAIRTIATINLR